MTGIAIVFAFLAGFLLLTLPKPWAALPLLTGAGYMSLAEELQVGLLHFTVIRILLAVGAVRVIARGERIKGGLGKLDRMMILWGACAIVSSLFHEDFASALVARLGLCYDLLGIYFLFRVFIQDPDNIHTLSRIVIIVLVPVAAEMAMESLTGKNSFSFLGGVLPLSEVRNGQIRAQGPFSNPILAGTVGAVCWPLLLPYWRKHRGMAVLGIVVSATMTLTSRSSGPVMTAIFIFFGLCAWNARRHLRAIRWGALAAVAALSVVMNAPVYYLLARIDITGNSTGWHRAELIHSAITHVDEWWLAGTDRTRHWMPSGVPWSKNHTDITNHYIKMGIIGGLPLMLSLIAMLVTAFKCVGRALRANIGRPGESQFMIWTLGSILFGHSLAFLSISYFDQSFVFFQLVLAMIASLAMLRNRRMRAQVDLESLEAA